MINNLFLRVQKLAKELGTDVTQGSRNTNEIINDSVPLDVLITNKTLYNKVHKLFTDGHHARAVEEAFKLIDNTVKQLSNITDLSGSHLMNKVFSVNNPILRFNDNQTISDKDEQTGYMQILSGSMTGIRNPRAHESDWEDSEETALQLLVFANHLMDRITNTKR